MGKKVIIIDDSVVARRQAVNALTSEGYEIVEAVDGCDGFDKITAHADAALILCDMNMPRMTGLELLLQVRATGTGSTIPFLMLTTEAQPDLVKQARDNGAKGWLLKPIKPDVLLAAVRKLAG